jgi:hypothetical protein
LLKSLESTVNNQNSNLEHIGLQHLNHSILGLSFLSVAWWTIVVEAPLPASERRNTPGWNPAWAEAQPLRETLFLHFGRFFEQGHPCFHSAKADLLIKRLLANCCVEDNVAMLNTIQDVFHNCRSDALPLVFGSDSHVVYGCLVCIIRDCSTKSHQLITIVNEHCCVPVLERFAMKLRLAICHPDPL